MPRSDYAGQTETGDAHEAIISIEGRGRSIGEMALIDSEPRSATCEVGEQATLLLLIPEVG